MGQTPLSKQDQEAWEAYCDSGGTWPKWESLDERVKIKYRKIANEHLLERNAPWRHP